MMIKEAVIEALNDGQPHSLLSSQSPKPNMSPKKKHKQGQQALTEAELAERVCSICRAPVPGAFTWLDPDTQQPCYGTAGEAERAVGSPRTKWAQEGSGGTRGTGQRVLAVSGSAGQRSARPTAGRTRAPSVPSSRSRATRDAESAPVVPWDCIE
jgi:hypothetical protein